jgi:hypothetical protein
MADTQQDIIPPISGEPKGSVRLPVIPKFNKEIALTDFSLSHIAWHYEYELRTLADSSPFRDVEPEYEPPIPTDPSSHTKSLKLKLKIIKLKAKKFVVWCWLFMTPIERTPQLPQFQLPKEGEIEPQYEPPIETEGSNTKTRAQKWKRGLVTFGYFLWDCIVCVGAMLWCCAIVLWFSLVEDSR